MTVSNAELESDVRRRHGGRNPVVAAAVVAGGTATLATVGCSVDEHFEIGSVSKGITGLHYAEALQRGETGAGSTLGDFLPIANPRVATVTLTALSTHQSGLPRIPGAAQPWRRTARLLVRGTNPYGESLAELLDQVRDVRLGRPTVRYSNLGYQLLGHALARAAGMSYAELLRERITGPLGLATMHAPTTAADIRPGAVAGRTRWGRPREPWTGEALAPAGGIRASIVDMSRLVATMLDGSGRDSPRSSRGPILPVDAYASARPGC